MVCRRPEMCYNRCMKNGTRLKNWIGRIDWLLIGTLCVLIMGYVMLHDLCGGTLFRHNDWDSYTLQALAWREGRTALSQNYSWLELAVYNGQYYVSFPPLPSVVMLPLTYIWGADTPNNVVVMVFALSAVVCAYECFRKMGAKDTVSMFWAVFFVMGSNMLWMSTTGGVWFLAQGLNLALCFGAVWAMLCRKKTLCLALIALAVGCRPFSLCLLGAAFVYFCMQDKQEAGIAWHKAALRQAKYLILPLAIGLCYAWYNYARFGNPLEFGHNYLPEFSAEGSEQFGGKYLWQIAYNILLRPVTVQADGTLSFPLFDGFMFYIANPIFLVWFVYLAQDIAKKRMTGEKWLITAALGFNLVLLMVHKTFGGWQFGARYTVDLLPYVLWYFMRCGRKMPKRWELLLGAFAVLFNLYGALYMFFKG